MSYSTLLTEIRSRRGSSHALLIFRRDNQQIPVSKWNAAVKEAV